MLKSTAATLLTVVAAAVCGCAPTPEISKVNPFMARTSAAGATDTGRRGDLVIVMTALIHGQIGIVDGCVTLKEKRPALLIFGPMEKLVRTTQGYAIRTGDEELIAMGEQIEGSGGGSDRIPENLEAGVPERCRFGTYIFIHGIRRSAPGGPSLLPPFTPWRPVEH